MELRIFGMALFEMVEHQSWYANFLNVAIFYNHKGGIKNRRRCLRKKVKSQKTGNYEAKNLL